MGHQVTDHHQEDRSTQKAVHAKSKTFESRIGSLRGKTDYRIAKRRNNRRCYPGAKATPKRSDQNGEYKSVKEYSVGAAAHADQHRAPGYVEPMHPGLDPFQARTLPGRQEINNRGIKGVRPNHRVSGFPMTRWLVGIEINDYQS